MREIFERKKNHPFVIILVVFLQYLTSNGTKKMSKEQGKKTKRLILTHHIKTLLSVTHPYMKQSVFFWHSKLHLSVKTKKK